MPLRELFGAARQPRTQRIYTVPHGTPFLPAIAEALLTGNLPTPGGPRPRPLELASSTLLLPTRRDIEALTAAFLQAGRSAGVPRKPRADEPGGPSSGPGSALLLPKIKLISHSGETAAAFGSGSDGAAGGPGQPAIGKLEREL